MARQKGIIKLKGSMGDVSFYKSRDGHMAREKGGIDKKRIKNDPVFARTRENATEFGAAAVSGKLLRTAARGIMQTASDERVTSRMTQVMTRIKDFDSVHPRGRRVVKAGIETAGGKLLLNGFNFNTHSLLERILFKPFAIDAVTGTIAIERLVPANDIIYPPGATHIRLKSAFIVVNFGNITFDTQLSDELYLKIDRDRTDVMLTPANIPVGDGTKLYLLLIEFYQEVNGAHYELKNGTYNALKIVDVL